MIKLLKITKNWLWKIFTKSGLSKNTMEYWNKLKVRWNFIVSPYNNTFKQLELLDSTLKDSKIYDTIIKNFKNGIFWIFYFLEEGTEVADKMIVNHHNVILSNIILENWKRNSKEKSFSKYLAYLDTNIDNEKIIEWKDSKNILSLIVESTINSYKWTPKWLAEEITRFKPYDTLRDRSFYTYLWSSIYTKAIENWEDIDLLNKYILESIKLKKNWYIWLYDFYKTYSNEFLNVGINNPLTTTILELLENKKKDITSIFAVNNFLKIVLLNEDMVKIIYDLSHNQSIALTDTLKKLSIVVLFNSIFDSNNKYCIPQKTITEQKKEDIELLSKLYKEIEWKTKIDKYIINSLKKLHSISSLHKKKFLDNLWISNYIKYGI